jgi:poly(3-hydroxybutyrate) depolymerase
VGFSAGGMFALRLAGAATPVVRAVADVAGTMPLVPCAPGRPMSVLLVQGSADDELRGELRALRRLRAPRRTHALEDAMRYWTARAGCSPT